ncbi:MAG TPA: DUF1839 family protein [Solirubrobacteraceae bacterium]|nr:DUF1839 family protein [Solirubrobacteraceae bacterium]
MTVASSSPLVSLDPATYVPHTLHQGDRTYLETNCYADVLIEVLHARGDEPLAAMGHTLRLDFEGDQFSFFKPPPGDLERLFGVDVHEMQPYRPLPGQIAALLERDRTMIVEVDAWYLPDTAATSYRREHVKTSIAPAAIDPAAERLTYFHNAGLYALEGEDFRGVFRQGMDLPGDVLPPYVDLVRFDAGPRLTGEPLRAEALALLRYHLARRPATNPFTRFAEQLAEELPSLLEGDVEGYHAYAFATVRMSGSAFEIAATHVEWLLGDAGTPAAEALRRIVDGSKVLSFKLARRRAFDPRPAVEGLAAAWDEAMGALDDALA